MRESDRRAQSLAKSLRRRLTNAETVLWSHLRRRALLGLRFRRQHPIGPYVADFACIGARLVIEVDGATHCQRHEIAYDRRRDGRLARLGWRVLRVSNSDVYENLDGVLRAISNVVAPPRPTAHHPPQTRGQNQIHAHS
ncbi:MAG: endonuclease domain-containing protein [Maricaulaceae bacterium]